MYIVGAEISQTYSKMARARFMPLITRSHQEHLQYRHSFSFLRQRHLRAARQWPCTRGPASYNGKSSVPSSSGTEDFTLAHASHYNSTGTPVEIILGEISDPKKNSTRNSPNMDPVRHWNCTGNLVIHWKCSNSTKPITNHQSPIRSLSQFLNKFMHHNYFSIRIGAIPLF